jgi:hypothetical protein
MTGAEGGNEHAMARLENYSFGRLMVDGQEHTRDLIVLPERVVSDWWRWPARGSVVGWRHPRLTMGAEGVACW